MLLPPKVAHGVADGSVTLAFRRWRRPGVKVGSQFRTVAGVVRVTSVDVVDEEAVDQADAEAAGFADPDALRRRLRPVEPPAEGQPDQRVFRVGLAWAGEDPRLALRDDDDLDAAAVADLDRRLERLDRASSHGAWTMLTLALVRDHPHRRAPDLAAAVGRERDPFKIDVRKLKNLGLTQSFEVGYAISPRGRAYLAATTRPLPEPPVVPDPPAGR
ncbi:hypothetical protein RDV89_02920 [Nocardioides zeae]|uniref:ASCH domain-containing protein n=1 Tax=Nocardioides imazamoxiresistens TaxID=3231893 RepID=A0ABU3PT25_9ACTN|nr:hypothetical protein [Nocardioides zeae]MDT9592002.1 hypothetical protein [Nocardioides zeae]